MVLIGLIVVQGVYAALEHSKEALERITTSQWIEQDLAQQAESLSVWEAAVLIVPEDFNPIQKITIAHYVAALGERRAVVVNEDGEQTLADQVKIFDQMPFVILKPNFNRLSPQ